MTSLSLAFLIAGGLIAAASAEVQFILQATRPNSQQLILPRDAVTTTPSAWQSTTQYAWNRQNTESRYGSQSTSDPYRDSRYSSQQPGSSYDSSANQRGSSGTYDAYSQSGRTDPRYGSQQQQPNRSGSRYSSQQQPSGRYDQRYDQSRRTDAPQWQPQRPVDYSLYPPTLKSLVLSESSIYLFWVDPAVSATGRRGQGADETKYVIKYNSVRRGSVESGEQNPLESIGKDLTVSGLDPGTDYSFSIQANRNGQVTRWSTPISNRTLEALPRQPPSNIKVEARNQDVTITLSTPEGFIGSISSYLFLYAPSGGAGQERKWLEQQIPGGYSGSTSTVVLRNLIPNEEYFYTIQAINSRGSGPFTEIQSFKTAAYNPYGNYGGYDRQGTTQNPYGNADTTRYQYGGYGGYDENTPDYYGGYATTQYSYNTRTPEYVLPGDYNSAYQTTPSSDVYGRYRTTADYWSNRYEAASEEPQPVEAIQPSGDEYWSPSWEAATLESGIGTQSSDEQAVANGPEPPTDIKIESQIDPSDVLVLFVSSSSANVEKYEIQYSYDQSAADELWQTESIPGGESQALITRLTPEKWVYFRIRAKNAAGYGPFTEIKLHYTRYMGPQDQDSQSTTGSAREGSNVSAGGSASSSGSYTNAEQDGQDQDESDDLYPGEDEADSQQSTSLPA